MDFVVVFPSSVIGHNAIWVVVDRMTKSAYFLPMRLNFRMGQLVQLYIWEVVQLYGIPVSIVSDRDAILV